MPHPDSSSLPDIDSKPSQKKPRHRHSPAQLAALNVLFDQDDHPPLELRSALAKRLGMQVPLIPNSPFSYIDYLFSREAKTVSAWFQNKRASTKKRSKGAPSLDVTPANPMPTQFPPSSYPSYRTKYDDYQDDDYPPPPSAPYSRASSVLPSDIPSFYYPNTTDPTYFMPEGDSITHYQPSPAQIEELKSLYMINPHPSAEERQVLAERIGM